MAYYPWGLAVPVFGLAVCVAAQIALLRLGRRGLLRSLMLGFACGLGACLLADATLLLLAPDAPDALPALAVNAAAYGALGYCYFHFVNLGETARRFRIMREIRQAPGGLSEAELLARYNAREMVDKRLARLLGNGQVTLDQGRYVIRPSLILWITRAMTLAKRVVFGMGETGSIGPRGGGKGESK